MVNTQLFPCTFCFLNRKPEAVCVGFWSHGFSKSWSRAGGLGLAKLLGSTSQGPLSRGLGSGLQVCGDFGFPHPGLGLRVEGLA